tara:strand:- start:509 stop:658 length:150 start_codon:yes stop_codon:yes gene_type:complete
MLSRKRRDDSLVITGRVLDGCIGTLGNKLIKRIPRITYPIDYRGDGTNG